MSIQLYNMNRENSTRYNLAYDHECFDIVPVRQIHRSHAPVEKTEAEKKTYPISSKLVAVVICVTIITVVAAVIISIFVPKDCSRHNSPDAQSEVGDVFKTNSTTRPSTRVLTSSITSEKHSTASPLQIGISPTPDAQSGVGEFSKTNSTIRPSTRVLTSSITSEKHSTASPLQIGISQTPDTESEVGDSSKQSTTTRPSTRVLTSSITSEKHSTASHVQIDISPTITMPNAEIRPGKSLFLACNVFNTPANWTELQMEAGILIRAFANGTIQTKGTPCHLIYQNSIKNVSISAMFTKTSMDCSEVGMYTCTLFHNTRRITSTTANITAIGDEPSVDDLIGNTTFHEGDRFQLRCGGNISLPSGELHLYQKTTNSSKYIIVEDTQDKHVQKIDDTCNQYETKTYHFLADGSLNGSEFRCSSNRGDLNNPSTHDSNSLKIIVIAADIMMSLQLDNVSWDDYYADKNSQAFKRLAKNIENETDMVYMRSKLRDNYRGSKVISLGYGHVVVSMAIYIDLVISIKDSQNNVLTTKLNADDIVGVFKESVNNRTGILSKVKDTSIHADVTTEQVLPKDVCSAKVDIVFLLDASGSIGADNFQIMKYFIRNFTANLPIGPNHFQIGVVKFDSHVNDEFWLNDYHSPLEISRAIQNIYYTGGGTQIALGLQNVESNALTNTHGVRKSASQVIILITDGHSSDNPAIVASSLKREGVLIICVGIGTGVNESQLLSIASGPRLVFHASDFNVLINIKRSVQSVSCDETTPST